MIRMAARESSGEKATQEAKDRSKVAEERKEKAAKASSEGGVTPQVPVETDRQDLLVVAGEELRDGAKVDDKKGPFEFDQNADAATVDHLAVAANDSRLVLELDGDYFAFTVQQSLALRRLVSAGVINLNF